MNKNKKREQENNDQLNTTISEENGGVCAATLLRTNLLRTSHLSRSLSLTAVDLYLCGTFVGSPAAWRHHKRPAPAPIPAVCNSYYQDCDRMRLLHPFECVESSAESLRRSYYIWLQCGGWVWNRLPVRVNLVTWRHFYSPSASTKKMR